MGLSSLMGPIGKYFATLYPQLARFKEQIEKGDFTNDSEYIRHLVRTHQTTQLNLIELEMAIDEGLVGEKGDKSVDNIWTDAEWRYAEENGYKPT